MATRTTAAKGLKNADREPLKRLIQLVDDCSLVAIRVCLAEDCINYIKCFGEALQAGQGFEEKLFTEDSCILGLTDVGQHGKLASEIGTRFKALVAIVERVNSGIARKLEPRDAQKCVEEWESWQKQAMTIIEKAFPQQGCDPNPFFEKVLNAATGALEIVTKGVQNVLGGQVHAKAFEHISACILFFKDDIVNGKGLPNKEKLATFAEDVEKANRLSSVMEKDGKIIREGIGFVKNIVDTSIVVQTLRESNPESIDIEHVQALGKFSALAKQHEDVSKATGNTLEQLCKIANLHSSQEDQEGLVEFLNTVRDLIKFLGTEVETQIGKIKCCVAESVSVIDKKQWEIPSELLEPRNDINEFLAPEIKTLVKNTFCKTNVETVLEATVALESAIQDIGSFSKNLEVAENEICPEIAELRVRWRENLTWMSNT